jgi:hypothetical protein
MADALEAYERACSLPDEAFPAVKAVDVLSVVRWCLRAQDPPKWVAAALQDQLAGAQAKPERWRVRVREGACRAFWSSVGALYDAGDIPEVARPMIEAHLMGETVAPWTRMTGEEIAELSAWARGIPAFRDCRQDPFEVEVR